ncbi:MAG: hypothetical protein K6B46_04400 [Opitutales bacterium]|nr:hypothetical protein [Opitutales bacterium]
MKKYIISSVALVIAGTAFLNAEILSEEELLPVNSYVPPVQSSYVTMEAFYAGASKDIDKDFGEEVNIGGLWSTFGKKISGTQPGLSLDFAGILAIGGGSTEVDWHGIGTYVEEKYSQFDIFAGGQVALTYEFCESFSLTGGVMAGVDIRSMEYEVKGTTGLGYIDTDDDDVACGLFYGAFVRADTRLTNRWSLTASLRYMGTTTENEFSIPVAGVSESWKTEKVGYGVFTLGAKFSF